MTPTDLSDEDVAGITGLTAHAITDFRRKHLEKGPHFERGQGKGITWTEAGLRRLGELQPALAPAVDEHLHKKTAASVQDGVEELVVVGPVNDAFFKACRPTAPAQRLLVRTRRPDLFPPNFKFLARPSQAFAEKGWWEPVKLPRLRGRM